MFKIFFKKLNSFKYFLLKLFLVHLILITRSEQDNNETSKEFYSIKAQSYSLNGSSFAKSPSNQEIDTNNNDIEYVQNAISEEEFDFYILNTHQYIVLGWMALTVASIGIFGNIFTIFVLFKKMMRTSTNTYLMGLAISDLNSLVLILFLIPLRYILVSHGFLKFYEIHTILFPYLYPMAVIFQFSSIFLTLSASICRTLIVYKRNNSISFCDKKTCHKNVIFIFFLSSLISIPFWLKYKTIAYTDLETNSTRIYLIPTSLANEKHFINFIHITTILTYIIPLMIILAMNYLLIKFVLKAKVKRMRFHLKEHHEYMITFGLVLIVLLFFVCQMPNLIIHWIHAINPNYRFSFRMTLFHHWTNFLLIVNYSSNFAIYCLFGNSFRKTAFEIFKKLSLSRKSEIFDLRSVKI